MRGFVAALTAMLLAAALSLGAAPVVTNVTASQRVDGSGLVDIYYDVSGAAEMMRVRVEISNDGGASYNITPQPASLAGAVGHGVLNGTGKHIVWDAGTDRPEVRWTQCRAKVIAEEYAPGPTITINLPGTATLDVVRIPAGSFQMGSDDPGWSQPSELPVHTVNIGYDMWVGRYEVTQGQYQAIMGTNPASGYGVGDNYPVYFVSWNNAAGAGGFIQKLNEHVQATGQGPATFRLPSEAEWEYACRAGTTTRFSFGNSNCQPSICDQCTLAQYAWFCGNNSPNGAKPVGQKLPNAFGLYDMHGNLWEWCQDYWHDTYTGAPSDGSAWVSPSSSYRVLRGGYWYFNPGSCRSAYRDYSSPDGTGSDHGFRVVRTH